MRTLARFGAVVIEGGVVVVAAVGGFAAGGLRLLASIGENGDQEAGVEAREKAEPAPTPKPKPKPKPTA